MRKSKLKYSNIFPKAQKLGLSSLLIAVFILSFSCCFDQAHAQERKTAMRNVRSALRQGKSPSPKDIKIIGQKAFNRINTRILARQATNKGSNPKNFSGLRGKHQLSSGAIVVPIGKEGETGHVAFNGQAFKINVHNGEVQIRNSKGEVQDLKGLGWYAMVDTEDGLIVFSQTPIEEAITSDNSRITKNKDWFLDNDIFSDDDSVDELVVESDLRKVDKLSEAEQFAVLDKLTRDLVNNVVTDTTNYFKDLGQALSQSSGINGLRNLADDFISGLSDIEYLKTKVKADIRLAQLESRIGDPVDNGTTFLQPPAYQVVRPGVADLKSLGSLSRRADLDLQNLGVTNPTWVRLARFERFQKAADLVPAIKPNFTGLKRGLAKELNPALARISQTPHAFKNSADNSKLSINDPNFKVGITPLLTVLGRVSGKVMPVKPILVNVKVNPRLSEFTRFFSAKQIDSAFNFRLGRLANVSSRTFNATPNLKAQDIYIRPEIRPSFQRLSEVSSDMVRKPLEEKALVREINFRFKQLAELTQIAPVSLDSRYFSQEKIIGSSSPELARSAEARKVLARVSSRRTVPKLGLVRFIRGGKDSRKQTIKTLELAGVDVQNVLLLGDNYLHHPVPYYFSSESKYMDNESETVLASFLLHSNIIKRQLIIHNISNLYD